MPADVRIDPFASLPIRDCLFEILESLANQQAVVLKAPPGAGKTTGVPPALMQAEILPPGKILLIQPRRLAARAAASQLARIIGGKVGEVVGYHVRFDRQESHRTRLLVLTYGMLLRRLQTDPLLETASCVILDEFHERSLDADLALGRVQQVRTNFRPELRLIVMSATLEPAPIVSFLSNAVAIKSEGRMFPVQTHYRPALNRQSITDQLLNVLPEALAATTGNVLVFLPGVGEILKAKRSITSQVFAADCDIFELYADLAVEEQDRVLNPSSRRKIILATNVAETSLTIEGITVVIDSGTAKVLRYEPSVGLPRLRIEPISQASADQRTGRAGRTSTGVCYRLWNKASHSSRNLVDAPEIRRADFAPAAMVLASWGDDAKDFPWLDPPLLAAIDQANQLLKRLQAIDENGRITADGQLMAELPVHPSIAKLLIVAARTGVVKDAAIIAALLTEKDPFRVRSRTDNVFQSPAHGGDMVLAIELLRGLRAAGHIERVAKQLVSSVRKLDLPCGDFGNRDTLKRALIAAFPDRVAKRREVGSTSALLVGGKGVRLHTPSVPQDSDLLLCLRVDSLQTDAMVSLATNINQSWLDPKWLRNIDEPFYQTHTGSIVARRREYYFDLVLSETPIQCKPNPQSAILLAREARAVWKQSYPPTADELKSFIARVELLRDTLENTELIPLDEKVLDKLRDELAQRCLSLQELTNMPWLECLKGQFDYNVLQQIDREAPARLQVPSGNSIFIQYESGKPPMMSVRLQELFGWHDTPRIARGRIPIQLHLLGPNRRVQQITSDLRRFWESTYAQVRKDLRGRYPKHNWPEDPFSATATHNGMKPR